MVRKVCGCGKAYWSPGADWQHVGCKVDTIPHVVVNTVVNAKSLVVDKNRKKDRHKKVRTEYFREYMRVRRAIKSGRAVAINAD